MQQQQQQQHKQQSSTIISSTIFCITSSTLPDFNHRQHQQQQALILAISAFCLTNKRPEQQLLTSKVSDVWVVMLLPLTHIFVLLDAQAWILLKGAHYQYNMSMNTGYVDVRL
jgi:hypothetical protein